jgi:ribonuclease-3
VSPPDFTELQARIGYRFRNPELLRESLTHKSFTNEQPPGSCGPHNERLEFLGDAVLDLVISHRIFQDFPLTPEGEMTRIRAEVVSEKSLSRLGRKIELGQFLLLGKGEERSGGREKDSLVADALEALLGAVFCDGGIDSVREVAEPLFGEAVSRSALLKEGVDHKTRLQEILQASWGRPPEYLLVEVAGPDHQRTYTVEVVARGEVIGQGKGKTKKAAEQKAAREALAHLEE